MLRDYDYQEHVLYEPAQPFSEKLPSYLSSYERLVKSRNYRYIIECGGEIDEEDSVTCE